MLALTIGITKYGHRKISMADTDVLLPVALACVLGGIALETVFCVAYYKCCCYIASVNTKRDWLICSHVSLDKCNVSRPDNK
jgi:hypothetical protein